MVTPSKTHLPKAPNLRLVNAPLTPTPPSSDSMLVIEKLGLTRKQFESFTAIKSPQLMIISLAGFLILRSAWRLLKALVVISVCLWLIGSLG